MVERVIPFLNHRLMDGEICDHAPAYELLCDEAPNELQPLIRRQFMRQSHVELSCELGIHALFAGLNGVPQRFTVC